MRQRKKITSIANIDCTEGKLRFGTIDKKNPSVMFIEGGFYIMPQTKKDEYKTDIDNIKKEMKDLIKDSIQNSKYFKPEHMFFTDIADERILYNKKTYFSFQLFVKPKKEIIDNNNFKVLLTKIDEKESWIKLLSDNMNRNGFITTKTKKSQ